MRKIPAIISLFFILVACFFTLISSAQIFGGNPPSFKWNQVSTDSARIIFPEGLDSQAQRVASIVHHLAARKPVSMGDQFRKINIVLQNQTTIPNGYVGLGPFRSEFFLSPVMNNFEEGSISWTDQLAIHEYRHVQQFNNFRNGISKAMYYLFGEEGLALAINASVPDWFYEGDAVYNETILSSQGRGRLPLFNNAFPALWQAGKNYSWMKLRNGSYKDYIPNHYYLGYLLVNYGREKYGLDFWSKVTQDASAYKGLIYPFQKAIEKHAGVDYKTFREQAFDFYKGATQGLPQGGSLHSNVTERYVTNYYFPYSISADSLLYLKRSYRHRPAFYIKDGNGEHKLRTKDIAIDEQFSYRNGKIVYAAYETDPRWGWKDYSVIKLLDVQSGQQKTLTHKTKYFTPDISASGKKIAVVQVQTSGKSELHVLDAKTGEVIQQVRALDISLFTDPKFIDEDSIITAVRLREGRMALALVNLPLGSITRLTTPSFNVVGYPSVSNGVVYFTASYGGNDDVFALRLQNRKLYRLTSGSSGNYFANAANGKITWSTFTADGYQLRQMDEKDMVWEEVSAAYTEAISTKYPVSYEKEVSDILISGVERREFPVSKYRKSTRLLNFHSWRPYYSDPIFTYSIYGENILNTLQTELYYLYNENEKTSAVGFNTVYGGFFPFLNLGTEYTFNREAPVANRIRRWDQLDIRFGLNVPLSFTSGRTFKNLNFGSFYVLRNEFNKGFFKDSIGNTTFSYLQHFISWNQQVQSAVQHIFPRWGYALSLNHRHAISSYEGYQFIGSSAIYLPGAFSTHNLVLTGAFQQRDTLNDPALFGNRFSYSRGFTGRYFSRMWRLSANYHFPVFYPDWGFGNILYLQRIRANGFYDFTKVYSRDKTVTADQRSVGGEVFIDTKWWNQHPLTFGFRVSRLLDPDQFDGFKGTVFEFILPVSIIPR